MRHFAFGLLLTLATAALFTDQAAPQEEKKKKDGPPPGAPSVVPPFILEKLKLTKDQEQKLGLLSTSVQLRLGKILTDQQMQQFQEIMKQGPGGKDGKNGKGGKEMMPKGPKRAPGLVIPPFAEGRLKLTATQQRQVAALERFARGELAKILTPVQQRQFEVLLRQGPGDMPGGRGQQPKGKMPPEAVPAPAPGGAAAGIQWFSTWDSGLKEARRSGRPILLVAAAPHCGGVSGVW